MSLREHQARFAAHIRRPAGAMPHGLRPERMALYRELVLGKMQGFVDACFPVLRRHLGKRRWNALVRRFLAQHRCATPYFREIPSEFIAWLFDEARPRLRNEPGFLPYLAHYEWLELAVATHPDAPTPSAHLPWRGMPDDIPVLNGALRVASYPYAVQRIAADTPEVPMQPTWLMVWRNTDDEVRFAELNAPTFDLLNGMLAGPRSARHHATVLQAGRGAESSTEAGLPHVMALLMQLAEMGVVMGMRAC